MSCINTLRPGDTINGLLIDEVIIERIYCDSDSYIYNSDERFLTRTFDMLEVAWCLHIGIYKSSDQIYLSLEPNLHSSEWSSMLENGIFLNLGITRISEDKAYELYNKLSQMGANFSSGIVPNFEIIIGALTSIIPCQIRFLPLLSAGGYYEQETENIVIGNNQGQLDILFALIHEYTHYLLRDYDYHREINTIKDYITDGQEFICNIVAAVVCNDLLHKSMMVPFEETKEKNEQVTTNILEVIDQYSKKIINQYREVDCSKVKPVEIQVRPGLIALPKDENKRLFEIILNEISPVMPVEEE